ncbi:hypothetical protein LCGC14_1459180 [marine sediment metagenome]|uniref:Uncharacterized protein n=1 Tax=marine sediment metagenome TaxID=412755 RepID=A0A0F9JG44_9ZZZZ
MSDNATCLWCKDKLLRCSKFNRVYIYRCDSWVNDNDETAYQSDRCKVAYCTVLISENAALEKRVEELEDNQPDEFTRLVKIKRSKPMTEKTNPPLSKDGEVHRVLWPDDEVKMLHHSGMSKNAIVAHYRGNGDITWTECPHVSTCGNAMLAAKERLAELEVAVVVCGPLNGQPGTEVTLYTWDHGAIWSQAETDTEPPALAEAIIAMGEARKNV